MGKSIKVDVRGERCSGTNYLYSLIKNNFPSAELVSDFGWKHDFLDLRTAKIYEQENYHLFFVSRNPYDWVQSLYKHPHHIHPNLREKPFSEFIRSEWYSIIVGFTEYTNLGFHKQMELYRERHPVTLDRIQNVFHLRNLKNQNFIGTKNIIKNTDYVTLERLHENWEEYMNEINDRIFQEVNFKAVNVNEYKGYNYLGKYVPLVYPRMSDSDYNYMTEQLDWSIENILGYTPESIQKIHQNL